MKKQQKKRRQVRKKCCDCQKRIFELREERFHVKASFGHDEIMSGDSLLAQQRSRLGLKRQRLNLAVEGKHFLTS